MGSSNHPLIRKLNICNKKLLLTVFTNWFYEINLNERVNTDTPPDFILSQNSDEQTEIKGIPLSMLICSNSTEREIKSNLDCFPREQLHSISKGFNPLTPDMSK